MSILSFIYLGEATIYYKRMNEFLTVAMSLEIKEIGKVESELIETEESALANEMPSSIPNIEPTTEN